MGKNDVSRKWGASILQPNIQLGTSVPKPSVKNKDLDGHLNGNHVRNNKAENTAKPCIDSWPTETLINVLFQANF